MSNQPSGTDSAFYVKDLLNKDQVNFNCIIIISISRFISFDTWACPYWDARQLKQLANLSRRNLLDLLDSIRLKRKSGAANQRSTLARVDCKSILALMAFLLVIQAHYSPFIGRSGSALLSAFLAGRDNDQVSSALPNFTATWQTEPADYVY